MGGWEEKERGEKKEKAKHHNNPTYIRTSRNSGSVVYKHQQNSIVYNHQQNIFLIH